MNNAKMKLIGRSDDLKITMDIPEPCTTQELLDHFEIFMKAMGYHIPDNEQLDIVRKDWAVAIEEAEAEEAEQKLAELLKPEGWSESLNDTRTESPWDEKSRYDAHLRKKAEWESTFEREYPIKAERESLGEYAVPSNHHKEGKPWLWGGEFDLEERIKDEIKS
jgi:hypothetical protein